MMPAQIAAGGPPLFEAPGFDAVHLPASGRSAEAVWYDVFAVGDGRFVISTGSVPGTGAGAKALMSAVREAFAGGPVPEASALLAAAAEAVFVRRGNAEPAFATAIVGILDGAERTFTYVCAGHPPPSIRYHDGTVTGLPADGLPLGLDERDHPTAQVVVELDDVELLVLFSGSLMQPAHSLADGLNRFGHVLADDRISCCGDPAGWIARRMLGSTPHDEVAVLVLTFPRSRPARRADAPVERPRWIVSWSFDSNAAASNDARRAFLACLASKAGAASAIDRSAAELIFGELLGNVVRHAPGPVEIRLDWTGPLPVLHVLDSGPGFRSRRKRERLPVDDWSESGRGLFIVNACAEQFSVRNRSGRGTHACATLPAASLPPAS
jgi:anti-sigma regulatory factor (Ser/Thr protein kinase)